MEYIRINEKDNVAVNSETGHKLAVCDIKKGERVIKYGFPIGVATADIEKGQLVHTHNLTSALTGSHGYEYKPEFELMQAETPLVFNGYVRKNGEVGIRNEVWVIPTVGCINGVARTIAERTGAFCLSHPYGCSQLGGDLQETQKTLSGLINNPNAGGVLVVGLGCENNSIKEMQAVLGDYDKERIRFLNCSSCTDEISEGTAIISELKEIMKNDIRTSVPVSKLKIGLKCGGSDGFSGITANPMLGKVSDRLIRMGGTSVLTEVPEMFGAEEILFKRCVSKDVFDKAVMMINNQKNRFTQNGCSVSENPSPGNREGGITTLEEKSLGCITKGGTSPVTEVLFSGERTQKHGLILLDGPGNDIVAVTKLAAAGCQLILFTTGRGTPLGAPIPTVKVATNGTLAANKRTWIDLDATESTAADLFDLVISTANGNPTRNEINNYREIAILKTGVTL